MCTEFVLPIPAQLHTYCILYQLTIVTIYFYTDWKVIISYVVISTDRSRYIFGLYIYTYIYLLNTEFVE